MTIKETGHSPLPWSLKNHGVNEPEYGNGIVHSFGGAHRFAEIQGVGILESVDMDIQKLEANAHLIVTAVNAHEDLRGALERIQSMDISTTDHQNNTSRLLGLRDFARTVLARSVLLKAKGGAL